MEESTDNSGIGQSPAHSPRLEPRLGGVDAPLQPDTGASGDERIAAVDLALHAVETALAGADDGEPGSARLIRPYAMTGGRTSSHPDISLESQIQTSTRLNGDATKYRWEAATILKLAERPMALVELAARAEIPIGVARVVISDLVDAGAVNVQPKVAVTSYTSLLEKVLDGIRDL